MTRSVCSFLDRTAQVARTLSLAAVAYSFAALRLIEQSMEAGTQLSPDSVFLAIAGPIVLLFVYHVVSQPSFLSPIVPLFSIIVCAPYLVTPAITGTTAAGRR